MHCLILIPFHISSDGEPDEAEHCFGQSSNWTGTGSKDIVGSGGDIDRIPGCGQRTLSGDGDRKDFGGCEAEGNWIFVQWLGDTVRDCSTELP